MADIVDVLLADYRRIRRLLGAFRDAIRYSGGPGADRSLNVWLRLAQVLEEHMQAAGEIYYPALAACGEAARAELAVADLMDLREALAEAELQPGGSAAWWRAVETALRLAQHHVCREEQFCLPVVARRIGVQQRERLGRQWAAFLTARARDRELPASAGPVDPLSAPAANVRPELTPPAAATPLP